MDNIQQPKPDRKGFAIASVSFGLISVIPWLISLISFLWASEPVIIRGEWTIDVWFFSLFLTIVSGLAGLILGVSGLKSSKKRLARSGMVLCISGFLYF
jgi:hypothetical protein